MNSDIKKILVIDDDDLVLARVEKLLTQNNYTSICANSGKTGIKKAEIEQPDAIILDRRMPKMDGNATLIKLKANENTEYIPVIMLTSDKRVEDISTSLTLGALDYIVKPFDPDNFMIRLEKTLLL